MFQLSNKVESAEERDKISGGGGGNGGGREETSNSCFTIKPQLT